MKIPKNRFLKLFLMIIVFLGLLYAVYIGYQRHEQKKWEDDMEMNALFQIKEDAVVKWELNYDGKEIVAERGEGLKAHLTKPLEEAIDYNNFLAEVKNFNSISTHAEVDEGKNNLSKWGIDLNRNYYRVFYKEDGTLKTKTIYRGKKLEFTEGYYIYEESNNKVYAAKFWVIAALEKSVADLRSKVIFQIDPKSVQKLKRPDFEATLIDNEWSIEGIEPKNLDLFNLDSLLSRLTHIHAEAIYDTGEINLDFKDAETIDLLYLDHKKMQHLSFSLIQSNKKTYLKISNDDKIYMLDSIYYDTFVKPKAFYIKQKN